MYSYSKHNDDKGIGDDKIKRVKRAFGEWGGIKN